jgi:hypothetical protein
MITAEQGQNLHRIKEQLISSTLFFTQYFYKARTGKDFILSHPPGRLSHQLIINDELLLVEKGKTKNLILNTPGRSGKTEIICHWIARMFAIFPKSSWLYISVTHNLATDATIIIRDIIRNPYYKFFFGVELREDSQSKHRFTTTAGGSIEAIGAGGTITGKGAGIMGSKTFGGAIVIDDIMNPEDALSDVVRSGMNRWYMSSIYDRVNSINTPRLYIGHRLHEDDLSGNLSKMPDWKTVTIPALDIHGNSFFPEKIPKEELLTIKGLDPYIFAAKYQQNPSPPGGILFKEEDFPLFDKEPEIESTFITADTAETDKTFNDATVFSFWGVYRVSNQYIPTNIYALHWISCVELRVEPAYLEAEFMQFWASCMTHRVKPEFAAIEKKSTGTTLLSILKHMQGIKVLEIDRNVAAGSKSARFLSMQPYISQHLVSLPRYGKHTYRCLEHMKKITPNGMQRFDDIADTCYDAIKLALIDKTVIKSMINQAPIKTMIKDLSLHYDEIGKLKQSRSW